MDTKSKETLDMILSMDKDTLTEDQLAFVMARRGYLNDEQRKRFADEIELHEEGKLFNQPEKPVAEMSLKELKAKAKSLDIKAERGWKEADFIEAINEVVEA